MTRFKGYKNRYSKNNRIFSMEDLLRMTMSEFFDRENEIDSQDNLIGLPTNNELKNSPNVRFVESSVDKNGQNIPARWESFVPMPLTSTSTFTTSPAPTGIFPELDEFQRNELEKLRKSRERQTVQLKPINPTNIEFYDSDFEEDSNDELFANNEEPDRSNTANNPKVSASLIPDETIGYNKSYAPILPKEGYTKHIDNIHPAHKMTHIDESITQQLPKVSNNVANFMEELLNKSQTNTPIYPENGVLKGSITKNDIHILSELDSFLGKVTSGFRNKVKEMGNNVINSFRKNDIGYLATEYIKNKQEQNDKDNETMNKSIINSAGGYIKPVNNDKNYNDIDATAINYNKEKNPNNPDAKQLLEIGIYGVNSYKDNAQFKHIKDGSADIFNEKYNLKGKKTIPSDMKGIEFSKDSEFSKRISENKDFQQTVKDSVDNKNGTLPDKIELNFVGNTNLNYSIGNGTLLNAHITKDGYIEGILFDKYDYEFHLKEYAKDATATTYNNGAFGLQKLKHLEDYYYFVPIRFKY